MGFVRIFRGKKRDSELTAPEKINLEIKLENEVTRNLASNLSSLASGFFLAGSIGVVTTFLSYVAYSVQKADLKTGMPPQISAGVELYKELAYAAIFVGFIGWACLLFISCLILAVSLKHEGGNETNPVPESPV